MKLPALKLQQVEGSSVVICSAATVVRWSRNKRVVGVKYGALLLSLAATTTKSLAGHWCPCLLFDFFSSPKADLLTFSWLLYRSKELVH